MHNIPKISDGTAKIIIVLILLIFGTTYINKILKAVGLGKDKTDSNDGKKILGNIKVNWSQVKIPKDTLESLSNKLYNAMKGIGTNDSAVLSALSIPKNTDEMLALIVTFGIKGDMTLPQWVDDEIDQTAIFGNSIEKINAMLKKKGIKYAF